MRNLESVAKRIAPFVEIVSIKGSGAASFLIASGGNRGFELYFGDGDECTIDPFEGEDLLGEINFKSTDSAVDTGVYWIKKGKLSWQIGSPP